MCYGHLIFKLSLKKSNHSALANIGYYIFRPVIVYSGSLKSISFLHLNSGSMSLTVISKINAVIFSERTGVEVNDVIGICFIRLLASMPVLNMVTRGSSEIIIRQFDMT